jgi:hypothetical protein
MRGGLWAATWKICQKYWLFGPHGNKKLGKYTQNIEKSLILDSSLGRGSPGGEKYHLANYELKPEIATNGSWRRMAYGPLEYGYKVK